MAEVDVRARNLQVIAPITEGSCWEMGRKENDQGPIAVKTTGVMVARRGFVDIR